MEQDLLALRQRLEHLENRPSEDGLTPEQLRAELDRLERRFRQERVRDLEYVVRTLTASEHRVGTWMDQTQEALTLVALRQDPRFSEQ
jgi:predicted transcriptional regulator of viral defense system